MPLFSLYAKKINAKLRLKQVNIRNCLVNQRKPQVIYGDNYVRLIDTESSCPQSKYHKVICEVQNGNG